MTDKSEVQAIVAEELDRNSAAVTALIVAHPDIRTSIACAFLGAAVATADTMGVDVEGFIASLRKRYQKPDVLVPPKANARTLTPEQWSAAHPIGTTVRYWPILPPRREDIGFVTRTRSEAWALSSGDVVVMIEGRTGGVHVTHLDILGDSDDFR